MKILLVSPLSVQDTSPKPFWTPLGLAFIASMLQRGGHRVSIFDRHVQLARIGLAPKQIDAVMLEHIRKFRPDLIGMNTVSPLIYDTVENIRLIRKIYPGPIVAGGHHASALPELTLKKIAGLNGAVVGEGELPMAKIAEGEDPGDIPGVWWKKGNGEISSRLPIQNMDLDRLPFPAHELLDMNFYTRPSFNAFHGRYISSLSVLSSRGCPRRCEFCTESLTYGKGVRFHGTRYMMEWIEKLLADYKVGGISFLDNDFLVNESRARDICENILSRGLHKKFKWVIQARADNINAGILRLLSRAGCSVIEIGVESDKQSRLDAFNKAVSVETNKSAIALCRKAGIAAFVNMLAGFPGETLSDLQAALRWLKRAKPTAYGWGDLRIFPGSVLYAKMGNGFFEKNPWDRQTIERFYQHPLPGPISRREREYWKTTQLRPDSTFRRCLAALSQNSIFTLIRYTLEQRQTTLELLRWMMNGIFKKKLKKAAVEESMA